jgi:5,10-methylenetetrahydrofolate reductase
MKRAQEAGIRQVLCIRGDHDAADGADTPKLREVVAMARETMPGAAIGATFNQYAPRLDAVFRNLGPKIDAGATYVQTQPVFDLEQFRPAAERLREQFPGVRIVTMAMPLLSIADAERVAARLGITLPGVATRRIAAGTESAWELFEELIGQLAASPLVDGAAIMTAEMDPAAETAARIAATLTRTGACGPAK